MSANKLDSGMGHLGGAGGAAAAANKRRGRIWPLLIVGLLVVHVLGMLTATVIATRDRSFVVLPNYYQRALHWDEQKAAEEASAHLGWTRAIELGSYDAARGTRTVTLRLTDREGKGVEGLTVAATAAPELKPNDAQSLTFTPSGDGRYTAVLNVSSVGQWSIDLDASGPNSVHYVATAKPWVGR